MKPEPLDGAGRCPRRFGVDVEQRHRRTLGGQGLGGRGADRARAGDHRHLPGQRLGDRALQLRLLQAPIFEREEIARRQRLVAADPFGVGDHAHRVLGKIRGNMGVLRRAAQAEQADPRHQHDTRARIELGLGRAHGRILAGEIVVVAGDEIGDALAHGGSKIAETAGLRFRQDQRRVLGADDMVRRHHAPLAVVGKLHATHIGEDLRPGAEGHDEARGLPARRPRRKRASPANDGRDLRRRGERGRTLSRPEHDGAPLAQAAFGEGHHLDHALIGFARTLTEGEDAMLVQDQAFDVRVLLEDIRRFLGKPKARRDVGHDP